MGPCKHPYKETETGLLMQDNYQQKLGIKYTPDKGRHVFARNDIEKGEIVSVEKVPLVMLLLDPTEGK